MLPVAVIKPAVVTLPEITLPVVDDNPVTYMPAVDTTTTLLVPPMVMLALPLEAPILASLVPL